MFGHKMARGGERIAAFHETLMHLPPAGSAGGCVTACFQGVTVAGRSAAFGLGFSQAFDGAG